MKYWSSVEHVRQVGSVNTKLLGKTFSLCGHDQNRMEANCLKEAEKRKRG